MMNKTTFSPMVAAGLFDDKQTLLHISAKDADRYEKLKAGLTVVAVKHNHPKEATSSAAAKIVDTVLAYEATALKMAENPVQTVEDVFRQMAVLGDAQRLELLHQMYFSLSLYTDATLGAQLKSGTSQEALYQTFRAQSDLTEADLHSKILTKVMDGMLTPDALDLLTANLAATTGDNTFDQSVLGYRGCEAKALAAMRLYLKSLDAGKPMQPEAAALKVCATADIQGLSASFFAGNCGKLAVQIPMMAVIAVVFVVAAVSIIVHPSLVNLFVTVGGACLIMEGLSASGNLLADLVGMTAAAAAAVVVNGASRFCEAMAAIRAAAAEKLAEASVKNEDIPVTVEVAEETNCLALPAYI